MNDTRSKPNLTGLLALLLFAVFAVSILSVLLSGTEVYQRLSQRNDQGYDRRTAVQYLYTKARQGDRAGAVSVEDFHGADALVLAETWEGETYLTRVYCADGALRELYTPADLEAQPGDGEVLLPLESLELDLTEGLLTVTLKPNHQLPETFRVSLRSEEGRP